MELPSIETLTTIAGDRAKELRDVLEIRNLCELEDLLDTGKYQDALNYYNENCGTSSFTTHKLIIANEILGTKAIGYIRATTNSDSSTIEHIDIEYIDPGDAHTKTLMFVSGKGYRVVFLADIVQRLNILREL